MKILTVCIRGNVRSVTTAQILKDFGGYSDVLSMGLLTTGHETLTMLCNWADKILYCGDIEFIDFILPYKDKIIDLQIGQDVWQLAMHPNLVELLINRIGAKSTLLAHKTLEERNNYERAVINNWNTR